MKTTLSLLVLALAGGACLAAAPTLPGPAFPNYPNAEALKASCDKNITRANQLLRQLEKRAVDVRWLGAFDAFNAALEDLGYPQQFVSAVHPDKAVREASEACELRWNDFTSTLGQNEKLFKAVRQFKPRDAIDRELVKTTLEGFEDAGVSLPPAQRARAKELADRIASLGVDFQRHIRDAGVRVAYTEAELKGVPESAWKSAKRDDAGKLLLGVDYPTYNAVMQSAELEPSRERMWRAKVNEGGEANLKLLAEITQLRKEYATLFGAGSWAEFTLRRRMAETLPRAQAFLAEVKAAVEARERQEVEELRRAKAEHLAQAPDGARVERWDVPFYTERVRRARFSVDQEAFRQYFPPQESLQFCLRLIEKLMGVRYERVEGVTLWHPEVQAYRVSDAANGKALATLWVDLYPRDGKYNHAAVWSMRGGSAAARRVPQAALVVNFDRKGLTLDELRTLLHELGHSVHNNLSATRYVQQAGTSVKRDFVEAPSQMLEDWIYDKQVLTLFAEVCPTCKPVPDTMIEQAKAAKDYGKGVQQSRQHLFASYDLALYGIEQRDPMALWAAMEGATPLGHVKGTMFPAGFAHIATNYSAGYYGYLWSLVVAMDMRTAFGNNRLDAAVGKRYRDIVLANGSQRPPTVLVKEFLGREFNSKAFFDDLKK
ncbi:M3 family metallopeptidase [Aquabacterium sp.]|uniref:M3 family metallopeptidase n=1 Tax=Aquabacterium sp. TaxID=1872578 RepID=UPI002C7E9E60|nr:M3 family metallopeptidase [Aquabacterium sp.]HSW07697.1 M3 family metallopeptidase [Aquabacterium sp.]